MLAEYSQVPGESKYWGEKSMNDCVTSVTVVIKNHKELTQKSMENIPFDSLTLSRKFSFLVDLSLIDFLYELPLTIHNLLTTKNYGSRQSQAGMQSEN